VIVFEAFLAILAGLAIAGLYWEITDWRERRKRKQHPPDPEANSRPTGNVTVLHEHKRGR
jgi:hypothetical protein